MEVKTTIAVVKIVKDQDRGTEETNIEAVKKGIRDSFSLRIIAIKIIFFLFTQTYLRGCSHIT